MKLTFLGAAREVTGSCTLLEVAGHRILIDCGMEQGPDTYENCKIPVKPSNIDCVLLTHAHIDHSGKLPVLTAMGFRGKIYCTGATKVLCDMMLKDSAHIQESEAVWKNRKSRRSGEPRYVPLYTLEDVEDTMPLFEAYEYEKTYEILDGVEVCFIDAGHLLGSASIEVTVTEDGTKKVILFSGDIGNVDRPMIKDPVKPEYADIVVMEATYGNRLHGMRINYTQQLAQIIQKTLDRGGNLVIPAFAVGRTQEMLYLIRHIKDAGLVKNHPGFPVWVDSPMAVEATKIYAGNVLGYYDEEAMDYIRHGIDILQFEGLHMALTTADSVALNEDTTPKVIISASGMCEAGRIRHHLKHNLWRKDSTILFVGYQAEGTLGNKLLSGSQSVRIFGEDIMVRAQIEKMDGISGHADMELLLEWIGNLKNKPEKVFVNHGAEDACTEFAWKLKKQLAVPAIAPYNGAVYDLVSGKCLKSGNKIRIKEKQPVSEKEIARKKKQELKKQTMPVFANLLRAGRRLMNVIEQSKDIPNIDKKKFTVEIDLLCDKWEK